MEALHILKYLNEADQAHPTPSFIIVDEKGNEVVEFSGKNTLLQYAKREELMVERIVDRIPKAVVTAVRARYYTYYANCISPATRNDVFN